MRSRSDNEMCDLIRATFRASGLSMKRLSDESGVAYQSVHALLTGDRDPALSTVVKLCKVLDLELRPVRRGKRKAR